MVIDSPWPGRIIVSLGSKYNLFLIDSNILVKFLESIVLPGPPGKRVSPLNKNFSSPESKK